MVLALAIASTGSLVSARPLTRSASATNDNYLVDEIFPKPANVQHLYNAITGKTNATYADVMSAATQITNAANIRSYNDGNDIKVTFGGYVWDVVYLSTTNDNRPILTLWLQDPLLDKSQWNKWSLNDANVTYPCNMYGTSYIRSLIINSGQYAQDKDTLVDYKSDANYALKEFLPDGKYADLIVTPSFVNWQKDGENGALGLSSNDIYSRTNENWGDVSDKYKFNKVNGFSLDYSGHEGNDVWKYDNLWLVSTTEVSSASKAIWQVSSNQRSSLTWTRSSANDYANYIVRGLNNTGVLTTSTETVRPALHLDLAALNQKVTADLPNITVTYDGNDHQIANLPSQPEWYSENLPITYTIGGKDTAQIINAGEYNAKVDLAIFNKNFKITVQPRPIAYVGELRVAEKTYDATTKATVINNTTFDDLIEEDRDKVRLSINANFLTKDVDKNKPVVATVTLTGTAAQNYTLTNGGTKELSGNIKVCTVVVNGIKAVNKEYDNTDIATLNLIESYLSLTGDMRNDDVTVAATGKFRQKTIGENLAVDLDVKLDGKDAHNYVIGGETQTVCYTEIRPRAITVQINKVRSPINADLADLTATVQSGSLATGDTIDKVITLSTDADYAVLGEYTITGQSINPNYAVTFANGGVGVYEIYDPTLEPEPETTTANTPDSNLWLVIFCAGGVTAIVLILIILIAIIKHQHEKARHQQNTANDQKKNVG